MTTDMGSCGDNNVMVEGGFGSPVRVRIAPKTQGRMGGEDLVITSTRGDDGVREITIGRAPEKTAPSDGVTITFHYHGSGVFPASPAVIP